MNNESEQLFRLRICLCQAKQELCALLLHKAFALHIIDGNKLYLRDPSVGSTSFKQDGVENQDQNKGTLARARNRINKMYCVLCMLCYARRF